MNQEYVVIELPGNKMLMLCLIIRHYLNHADNTHVANQEEVLAYLNGLFEAVFISFRNDVSLPGEYKKLRLKRNSAKLLPKILDVYSWQHRHTDAVTQESIYIECSCGSRFASVNEWSVHSNAMKDQGDIDHSYHSGKDTIVLEAARDWEECTICGATK